MHSLQGFLDVAVTMFCRRQFPQMPNSTYSAYCDVLNHFGDIFKIVGVELLEGILPSSCSSVVLKLSSPPLLFFTLAVGYGLLSSDCNGYLP